MIRLFQFLFFLSLSYGLFGAKSLNERPITQLLHKQMFYGEDLPVSRISDLEIADNGFLWIASFDGLFRYDGSEFKEYSKASYHELVGGCLSLYEDPKRALWFGCNGNGLGRYKNGEFCFWGVDDGLDYSVYNRLFHDLNGLVILPAKKGLQTIINDRVRRYPIDCLNDYWIREVCFMKNGEIYLGLWDGDLIHVFQHNDQWLSEKMPYPEGIVGKPRGLIEGQNGDLWIGLDIGHILCLNQNKEFAVYDTPECGNMDTTWHLEVDQYGAVWGTYDEGIIRIQGDEMEHLKPDADAMQDTIIDIAITCDGAMFCCGYSSGLHLYTIPKLGFYTEADGLISKNINGVVRGPDGKMWIATSSGINVYDNGKFEVYRPDLFKDAFVRDLFFDSKNRLWVCVLGQSLTCIDGEHVQVWTKENGFPSNRFRMVEEDHKGNIWIGTQDGLIKMDMSQSLEVFRNLDGLGNNYVLSIFCDSKNRIWIGSVGGGLSMIENSELTHITRNTEAESGVVFTVTETKEHDILAGWVGGIIHVDSDLNVQILPFGKNEEKETIFGVYPDKNDNYWITGSRNIKRMDRDDLTAYLSRDDQEPKYDLFNSMNALPSKLVRANTRTAIDDLGQMWIPLGNGIALTDPQPIQKNAFAPKVNIHTVEVDHTTIYEFDPYKENTIILEPEKRGFRIQYTGISYPSYNDIMYKTRLNGFEDWVITRRNEAVYTNLKPKLYRFEVLARNLDGVWSTEPVFLNIQIKPAFYERKIFILIMSLLLLILLFGGFYLRTYQLRKRSSVLERIVAERTQELKKQNEIIQDNYERLSNTSRDLSASVEALKIVNENKNQLLSVTAHDLKNSVAAMVSSSNLLKELFGDKMEQFSHPWNEERTLLDMISNTGSDLLKTIQSLLNKEALDMTTFELKFEHRSVSEIVLSVVELNKQHAKDKGQTIDITEVNDVYADIDPLHLRMAVDNYISNATKYSPHGALIRVCLHDFLNENDEFIRLEIHDKGPGLTEDDKGRAFQKYTRLSAKPTGKETSSGIGLYLVKEIIEMHKGFVGVESEYNCGAVFYFEIPKRRT